MDLCHGLGTFYLVMWWYLHCRTKIANRGNMFYMSCNKITYSDYGVTSALQMLVCLNYDKQHKARRGEKSSQARRVRCPSSYLDV